MVDFVLQAGARTDIMVRLGAWSWDVTTGEELRVGAGLAEPYHVTWCAVEFFEASGGILRMLLQHHSPNLPHFGRTILHHGILCGNPGAVEVLLSCGADVEFPVKTIKGTEFHPIHMAARLGWTEVLHHLIKAGSNLNSATESGETALMISARHKQEECLKLLTAAGADFGLASTGGQSVRSIAASVQWTRGFQEAILDVIRNGKAAISSNAAIFSSILFVARANDIDALRKLIKQPELNIDEQDEDGFSAVMIAAAGGNLEAFRLLIHAGADAKLPNKCGETAISLFEKNHNRDAFEKVMLEYACTKGNLSYTGSSSLHRAANDGDLILVRILMNERSYDVNLLDGDGYTPLMLAARAGHGRMCELLISYGAKCDIENSRLETALSLARQNSIGKEAECVILDELARKLVLSGALVKKHTKAGKGNPHVKVLKMVENNGVLKWGKSSRRNVTCRGAEVGPSSAFRWNRRKKLDADEPGVFRVVTTKNKEFHFVCEDGLEMAELWVRGIKLVTREAIFGL